VVPDIITFAKGVTSGSVPMGGAIVQEHLRHVLWRTEHVTELFMAIHIRRIHSRARGWPLDLHRDEVVRAREKLELKWRTRR
jgi:beta-alanine--pyruvate transaminase